MLVVADSDGITVVINVSVVIHGIVVLEGDEAAVVVVGGIGVVNKVEIYDKEDVSLGIGEGDGVLSSCCFKQSSFKSGVSNTRIPESVSHNFVMKSVDTVHGPHFGVTQISIEASDLSVHF